MKNFLFSVSWSRVLLLSVVLTIAGCASDKNRLNVDVSGVSLPKIKIHRYEEQLFRIDPSKLQPELEKLKSEFRFFLETDLRDSGKLTEMKVYLENPRNLDFLREVKTRFRELTFLEEGLTDAFRHYKYYFPSAKVPRVYTYISGGDYEFPVQFADSVLLIGLDNYLGNGYQTYVADGLPAYRIERMTPGNIIPDCMGTLAATHGNSVVAGNALLDEMIGAGKRLYFIDAMVPRIDDRFKIRYTSAQADWIRKNEAHIWAAIVENRMLYSTDRQVIRIFMSDGPFTAEFSNKSPARMGEWIGWQIVKKYMDRQDGITLQQLLEEKDAQKILTLSGYKPDK